MIPSPRQYVLAAVRQERAAANLDDAHTARILMRLARSYVSQALTRLRERS